MTAALVAQVSTSTTEEEPGPIETWVEENSMLAGAIALLVVFLFGVAWTLAAAHRNARQKAMAPTAQKHGLHFSEADPFGSTKVAFPLFRAGDGRTVSNVMWREDANGRPVRAFDYSYYEEFKDRQGQIRKSWSHFSCAMARHNGLWPSIRIGRERALDKVVQRIGLPDIELESEEFNRAFVVQCEDRKFATDLLAPEMMELLVTTKALLEFETKGRWLLISTTRVGARDMPGLVRLAEEFVERIPPVVRDLYPHAPDDAGLLPEEGLGVLGSGGSRTWSGQGIFIPDHDLLRAEPDEEARPTVEYDLDGRPIDAPPRERPWG